jgi:hypothetical protein
VNFINSAPANCGTRLTRDFWTRGISLTNGMIRKTRFTDCLAHSAMSTFPRLGKVEDVLDQVGFEAQEKRAAPEMWEKRLATLTANVPGVITSRGAPR